jgi:histidinol dehydrogenase
MAARPASVSASVREILDRVRAEGDVAVRELTRRFDTGGLEPPPLRVGSTELSAAPASLPAGLRAALETAIANVATVAEAGVGSDREVRLPAGQRIVLREVPVVRAAVYVPGGRAPYPSTVVMGAITARAAGVGQVAVCAPPGRDGAAHPVILAACALCGVEEVYRMGGAQAVAALAYGTDTVPAVDVIVGPGNLYVQEAKRQLSDLVGLDGFAGPSDLLVLLDSGADSRLVALDMLGQAEHGPETIVAAVSPDAECLDRVAADLAALAADRPSAGDPAAVVLLDAPGLDAALAFADAFAPEHLQLVGPAAEALAPRIRRAGCVLVGAESATALGDYIIGSNHVLPTGGAARFASGLSPRVFRRRMTEVHAGPAAATLAEQGATIARAEGFIVHAESMEARIGENGSS